MSIKKGPQNQWYKSWDREKLIKDNHKTIFLK